MNMQPNSLWQPGEPRRIAIFRALQLGDLLVSVPAWRALRARFPYAEITFIGLPWAKRFVRRYGQYIDRFVEFPGYPGIDEVACDSERLQQFLQEQRAYRYDLALQMHGSGETSNAFVQELQADVTVGYYTANAHPPTNLTLSAPYPEDQHEILRNLDLVALLGCSPSDTDLEFPLTEDDQAEASALLPLVTHRNRPVIGLHPGSRPAARRWPAEYFAAVADTLVKRFGAQIVLTGGPDEAATVQTVADAMRAPALNLAGKTSLGALAALIERLDLFISNDTGPAHIASALNRPSITIFGPADYLRWAPLNQQLHATVRRPVVCSPCGFWECPIDHRCLRWLAPQQVIDRAERYLKYATKKAGKELCGA